MHVSLAVVCIQVLTFFKFDITLNYSLLLFTFLSTLVAYNFIKYFELSLAKGILYSKSLKLIYSITIVSFISCLFIIPMLSNLELITIFIISSLTVLYILPINSLNKQKKNLRNTEGIKIFIVAATWSLLTVLLPIIDFFDKIDIIGMIYFIQIFIYVFVAIIPFDIRDLNLDIKNLNTVPQNIGIQRAKNLGIILLFVFIILDFAQIILLEHVNLTSVLINIIICIILSILLFNSRKNQTKYYASFWVESLPIFWLLLNLILYYLRPF